MEEIDFEVWPYDDSGNGIAAAARRSPGYCNWTGGAASCCDRARGHSELWAFGTGGVRNSGRNRAVKTHRLVLRRLQVQRCPLHRNQLVGQERILLRGWCWLVPVSQPVKKDSCFTICCELQRCVINSMTTVKRELSVSLLTTLACFVALSDHLDGIRARFRLYRVELHVFFWFTLCMCLHIYRIFCAVIIISPLVYALCFLT